MSRHPRGVLDVATDNRWRAEALIPGCELGYRQTKNPIFVWEAYALARGGGIDLPEWVLTYFDRAAERIWGLARAPFVVTDQLGDGRILKRTKIELPERAEIAKAVAQALEFTRDSGGPVNPFRARLAESKGLAVAATIHLAIVRDVNQGGPGKITAAKKLASDEHGLSARTVDKIWIRYGQRFAPQNSGD